MAYSPFLIKKRMGLILKIGICESCSCKELKITELTGIYNESTNPGGWESPNKSIDNATEAIIVITRGDGTQYTYDVWNTAYGSFPSSNVLFSMKIPNDAWGYTNGEIIPDQIIKIKYIVSFDDNSVISTTIYKGLFCNTRCCVFSMLKNIDLECDECNTVSKDNFVQAYVLYQSLLANASKGNIIEVNEQLTLLNKICGNNNCLNCQ